MEADKLTRLRQTIRPKSEEIFNTLSPVFHNWLAGHRDPLKLLADLVNSLGQIKDLSSLLRLLSEKKVNPVIARRFSLEDAARAHRSMIKKMVPGKFVLVNEDLS